MSEDLVIGIDFGTTNCCVAVYENGVIKVHENTEGDRTTPSYLFFVDRDEIIAGKFAKKKAEKIPKNGIYELKRLIGRKFNDQYLQDLLKYLPYEVTNNEVNDPVIRIEINRMRMEKTVVELCCILFQRLKLFIDEKYGVTMNKVVVTVPAYFKVKQRQALLEAAKKAGFSVLKLLNEPTAAALCHFFEKNEENSKTAYSMVYDLGGGTFDVAILEKSLNNIKIISVSGDSQLGGHDFDNLIKNYVLNEVMTNYKYDLTKDNVNMARLHEICEEAKKALSTTKEYDINLMIFIEGHSDVTITLTRQKFEELANDLFLKTIRIVDECLKNSQTDKELINEVILAGGSTRIPKIQELISQYFGEKPIRKFVNPDECVAIGAALQAAMLSKHPNQNIRQITLVDVIPLSIGIADFVGRMQFLIKRNTPIPCKVTESFVTTDYKQQKVEVKVYEGERLDVRKNRCIAILEISDITSAPAGECEITVEMNVNESGILTITAKEELKNIVKELTVTYTRGDKSEFEIQELVTDAENMRIEDEEFSKVAEARAYLIEYCNAVISNLKTESEHAMVVKACENYKREALLNYGNKPFSYFKRLIEYAKDTSDHLVRRFKFKNMPNKKF